jgi:anti-sigma regulatory factor (Ser/Thr protein kinase)
MQGFRHEALLYAGEQEFLDGTVPFIREAVHVGEPILVVVDSHKLELLRSVLGDDSRGVLFADMDEVGANPGRIIPAWRAFVAEHAAPGRNLRGIGEPVCPGRGAAELRECHRHESLLNLAFEDADGFWLLCPYDTDTLDPADVALARYTHPYLCTAGAHAESPAWAGPEQARFPFDEALPAPAGDPQEISFVIDDLPALRRFVAREARDARMPDDRIADLVLAANEVATNSVCHGGGEGSLSIWREGDRVICEIRDQGLIDAPLAGREQPGLSEAGGRGLWLANQLCDLMQLRSFAGGSVVRLHMRA